MLAALSSPHRLKTAILATVPTPSSIVRLLVRRHAWFAGLLLIVFLSVQLATAAYACVAGTSAAAAEAMQQASMAAMEMDGMGCCPEATGVPDDGTQQFHAGKALCMGHCQADTKHADHPTPQVPPFIPVLVGSVVEPPLLRHVSLFSIRASAQPRAPLPPHAILHCCFRT